MLVLSRKPKERIVIDGNIEVVILAVQGDRVKLGIEAPSRMPVHRAEVQQRIADELSPDSARKSIRPTCTGANPNNCHTIGMPIAAKCSNKDGPLFPDRQDPA